MPTHLTVLSGNAVFPDGARPVRISIQAGKVLAVDDAQADESSGSVLIFPGFADIHVHAREYPRPASPEPDALAKWEAACRKETFATAGRAAINGGVTLFAAMPNDPVPPDDEQSYARKRAIATGSPCPVIFFAAVTPNSEPWADLPYKVYLDAQPSAVSFTSWKDLETALARYRGCRVFFHAEDPDVLRETAGPGPRWCTRPARAEVSAVTKILDLTNKFDLRTHICHVSTSEGLNLTTSHNRQSGRKVTTEITPHHLFFSVDNGGQVLCAGGQVAARQEFLGCNPPLRSEEDRRFLLEALKAGLIDALASDHAPHTLEDKRNGAPGMPHLDTLGLFAGWLLKECRFSPERIAEILASGPAQIMSRDLDVPQGAIEPGYAASFTVLDLDRETAVQGQELNIAPLETRCRWSPFLGIVFPAAVNTTIIRGIEYTLPLSPDTSALGPQSAETVRGGAT